MNVSIIAPDGEYFDIEKLDVGTVFTITEVYNPGYDYALDRTAIVIINRHEKELLGVQDFTVWDNKNFVDSIKKVKIIGKLEFT